MEDGHKIMVVCSVNILSKYRTAARLFSPNTVVHLFRGHDKICYLAVIPASSVRLAELCCTIIKLKFSIEHYIYKIDFFETSLGKVAL